VKPHGILVVDGADGCGKTTLAEHLVKNHGARYLHAYYRFKDRMPLYHLALLNRAVELGKDQLVVLDRWWMSELIYAAEYRGGTPWPNVPFIQDRAFMRYGVYVLCLPEDLRAYAARYKKLKATRYEMYESTVGVARRFNRLYQGLHRRPDVVRYNILNEGRDLGKFCAGLLEKLETRLRLTEEVIPWAEPNGCGNFVNPRVLFVGDRFNVPNVRRARWPFVSDQGSSRFLCEALRGIDFDEATAAWVNINDKDGPQLVKRLVAVCCERPSPQVRVVCLGELARRTLDRHLVSAGIRYLHHPQWYRRFHHHDKLLERDLKDVLR
jgi:thymidylate kinase